jgi:hypothetical protein
MSSLSAVLFLANGIRIGELLPKVQKSIPHKQQIKLLKIASLEFNFSDTAIFQNLSSCPSKKEQLNFLRRILMDFFVICRITLLFTKPGRHRVFIITHFHWNSCIFLCPLCTLAIYLAHRLLINNRRLEFNDVLFVFNGVNFEIFPLTTSILNKTLKKVAKDIGLLPFSSHEIKHGILTDV